MVNTFSNNLICVLKVQRVCAFEFVRAFMNLREFVLANLKAGMFKYM